MQKFLTSLGTAGGIVIIMMALLFMLLNFFGGLLMFGAGLLGLPRIRNKLKITGKKAFGVGFILYIVGFSIVVAFIEAPEQQPEMVQSTPKPQSTEPKPVDEVPQPTVEQAPQPVAMLTPVVATPPVVGKNEKVANDNDVTCETTVSDGDTATCLTDDKQPIKQDVEKPALEKSDEQCGSKRYCKEMTSCKEAKHYLNVCGVHRLDRDGDGIPCESLCK